MSATRPQRARTLTALTSMLVTLALLLPAIFVAIEADHDCDGDHCAICTCLHQATATMDKLSCGVARSLPAAPCGPLVSLITNTTLRWHSTTLLELGVRLDL